MMERRSRAFTSAQSAEIWERWKKGEGLKAIAQTLPVVKMCRSELVSSPSPSPFKRVQWGAPATLATQRARQCADRECYAQNDRDHAPRHGLVLEALLHFLGRDGRGVPSGYGLTEQEQEAWITIDKAEIADWNFDVV